MMMMMMMMMMMLMIIDDNGDDDENDDDKTVFSYISWLYCTCIFHAFRETYECKRQKFVGALEFRFMKGVYKLLKSSHNHFQIDIYKIHSS